MDEFTRTCDGEGNVLTVTDDAIGGSTTFTYDPITSALTSVEDAQHKITLIDPDPNGNPEMITTPEGRVTQITYTGQGQPERVTDVFGTVTKFGYDPVTGVLTSVLQGENLAPALQRLTEVTPTTEGYVDQLADAEGLVTDSGYDAMGRVVGQLLPGDGLVAYGYDTNGNLSSLTPPDRPAHDFAYTAVDLEARYDPPSLIGIADPSTRYTYNDAQQLEQVLRPDGSAITYGYDTAGRLGTLTIDRVNPPVQEVHTYSDDPITGQLQSISKPGGGNLAFDYLGERLTSETWRGVISGSVGRHYDASGRIDEQTVNGANPIRFVYDDDGLLIELRDASNALLEAIVRNDDTGMTESTAAGVVTDTWTYTPFGELDVYEAKANGNTIYFADYDRDRLGRITQKTEAIAGDPAVVWEYTYDDAGRLWQVEQDNVLVATYTYDDNGNRLTAPGLTGTPVYDDQDRLAEYNGGTYMYTAAGELVIMERPAPFRSIVG